MTSPTGEKVMSPTLLTPRGTEGTPLHRRDRTTDNEYLASHRNTYSEIHPYPLVRATWVSFLFLRLLLCLLKTTDCDEFRSRVETVAVFGSDVLSVSYRSTRECVRYRGTRPGTEGGDRTDYENRETNRLEDLGGTTTKRDRSYW